MHDPCKYYDPQLQLQKTMCNFNYFHKEHHITTFVYYLHQLCHNFNFGLMTKVETPEQMGPIAKSKCKMKKTYIHVKLQAPWNQGKASLELIE